MSIDEYFLRQASIFELRNIARDMGVLSPTIYKKEELISKVLKIQNGEEKPQMPKSRQGRPPKSVFSNNATTPTIPTTDKIISFKDIVAKYEPAPKNAYLSKVKDFADVLCCNGLDYGADSNTAPQTKEIHYGYFNMVDEEYGFIFDINNISSIDDVVFVPQNIIKNYGIRSGDLLEYKSAFLQTANSMFVYEILTVNGKGMLLYDRPNFNKLEFNIDDDFDSLGMFEVGKAPTNLFSARYGSRNVVCVKNNFIARDIARKFKTINSNFYFVNLFIDILPEDIVGLAKAPNIENFYTSIGESNKQNIQTITLALERIKRLAEEGKKVIFVISEAKKLIKQKNFSLDYCAEEIRYKSLDFCYQALALARNLKNGASITSFLFLKRDISPSNLEKYAIEEFDALDCNFFNIE